MKYLLDTHAFLWAAGDSAKLPTKVKLALAAPTNEVFVSAVTFWEIAIKHRLGKLDLVGLRQEDLVDVAARLRFVTLPLTPEESNSYPQLTEPEHKDPFDRLLAWQAIGRKLVLVSRDRRLAGFEARGLRLFW